MRKPKPVFRCGQTPRFWGLLAAHRVLTGPAVEADKYAQRQVVHARRAEGQAHLLVRATADDPVSLEELALDYLREPGASALPAPPRRTDPRRRWCAMTALTVLEIMRPGGDRYTTHLVVGFSTSERRAQVATVGIRLPVLVNPDKPGKIAIDTTVLFGQ